MQTFVTALESALAAWTRLLGASGVAIDDTQRQQAETATFSISHRIPAILRPRSVADVQECMRIANQFLVPVYPVSSGRNWGYGSRVPPTDGCVLLSLELLNRIVEFNEDLAYVTVEPGVTQRQLHTYLRDRRSKLWMDATGSSPDCSIIGNTMERGFGHTPMGDHASNACGFQVVLPNGDLIETGSARFPHSTTGSVVRWGSGPNPEGLFSQSNLGIVTRMTIWLMPEPPAFEAFFFRLSEPSALPLLINRLRDLRLREILQSAAHIGNEYRVLSGIQQYPWAEMKGKTPVSTEVMAALRKKLSFGIWNVSGALYGSKSQIAEAKGQIRTALRSLPGTLKFLKPSTLQLAKRFSKPFRLVSGWDLSRTVSLVEPVLGLMQGVPTEHTLSSAYWRKRFPVPADPNPDRDRCGLLWYSPTAPAEGKAVQNLTDLVSGIMLQHGFEPGISLTLISPRAVFCVASLAYDREVDGEDARAKDCYQELAQQCHEHGFYPYRLGIQGPALPESQEYTNFLQALKNALDPNGVLAPGRYQAV